MELLCKIAEVSSSGYYKHCKIEEDKDIQDYLIIKKVFDDKKEKLGARRIFMELEEIKEKMSLNKIRRIMRKYNIKTKIRKVNPYKNMNKKNQEHRTFPNTLNRQFYQKLPLTTFGTDITYLKFHKKTAYLSIIKDFCTGEIVGCNISLRIDMKLVTDTLDDLFVKHGNTKNFLIHSDQGFQYTSPIYINIIKEIGAVQSMSRKGRCIDNAPTESFFGHLKDEVDYRKVKTFEYLHKLINDYIIYYNTERKQWDKNKMSPIEYRNHILSSK